MELVFNDSQKLEIQSFEESDAVLKIKVINLSQEELEHLFSSEFATKKMQADSSVFENYTTFAAITKYTGGIFEVCMQQKEKGPTERLKEAESQIIILKEEISAKEVEIKELTSTTSELTSTTNELVLAIAESIGGGTSVESETQNNASSI
ncbi:hypothetical protein ACTQ6A_13990 [Lachnospiraceae bacterium LCP25S3_G4]